MPSDSHTNTVNLRPVCRSTKNATRGAIFLRIADSILCVKYVNTIYNKFHRFLKGIEVVVYFWELLCRHFLLVKSFQLKNLKNSCL